jgi:hypothetical protein
MSDNQQPAPDQRDQQENGKVIAQETDATQAMLNRVWDSWRFQVDSGWNRSNYFAVVETVALAGAWQVLEQKIYIKTALFFAFLGLLSSLIWLLNDYINHTYINYWWQSTGEAKGYEKKAEELKIVRWWPRVGLRYSHLMRGIPFIFCIAWLWMLGLFIPSPRCSYIFAMVGGLLSTWIVLIIAKAVSDRA